MLYLGDVLRNLYPNVFVYVVDNGNKGKIYSCGNAIDIENDMNVISEKWYHFIVKGVTINANRNLILYI